MSQSSHCQDRGVRWAERRKVFIDATVRGHRQVRFDVDVIDLSISGFRFETAFSMHVGTRLWLNVPGFQGLEAVIKWHEGFTYGCAFALPLHPAVCDHLIRQFPGECPP
ncbi:PilZ domain-containing protein [Rhizorhapis suberifaciens]|uniref:PilZ domain-containing protein n=1 Tax=Rhizorhapis suberifaciens TaxID=13656 RepID=A0A840HSS9_9SPHN|nr:PilZ domain-containing protein [Rhizorhapis suberifaciens]MBB4640983.1 hypothetical protein [Rhizorhapis suberifaciens]